MNEAATEEQAEKPLRKFIGMHAIKDVKVLDFKTPLDYDVLEVEYTDGEKEVMTKKFYEAFATEEQSDDTTLRDVFTKRIVGEILTVMAEWGTRYDYMNHIMDKVAQSHNEHQEEAGAYMYGVKYYHHRNMMHVQKILLEKANNAKHREDLNSGADSSTQE